MPTIAIVGASRDRSKYGNKAVRAYVSVGYRVFPINPKEKEIEGLPAFRSISEIPETKLDRVSFYVPPERGLEIIEDVAKRTVGEVWLNPGAESLELIARAEELGLNVVAACSIVDIGESPSDYT